MATRIVSSAVEFQMEAQTKGNILGVFFESFAAKKFSEGLKHTVVFNSFHIIIEFLLLY
jgi:hypothetical protein